jgi:CRISPR-associated endonuclease/helicase Cas3
MDFGQYFTKATGLQDPFPFQRTLAEREWPDLLDIPTGLGKTAAVTLAWVYKRGWRFETRDVGPDSRTPRRLVWCLPMRVLVEQTEHSIRRWLENLGLLRIAGQGKVSVHVLMGGADDLRTWTEHPEEDMVLIGTQDMLLSRALMRGYGMSRYQWPIHFALLHNDCFWAFDEVQLMGAGLATSCQLEAFRRRFPLGKSCRSLWLSATLHRDWLETVDLAPHIPHFTTLGLSDADKARAEERVGARKFLVAAEPALDADTKKKAGLESYLAALRDAVLAAHDPSSQTLVILNRVGRAQGLFRLLRQARPDSADLLIHARFRPAERRATEARLRADEQSDRIVVATQAIEAGVDVSGKVLFTELAPWSSLVQRFGRCNRYGEHNADGARVHWIDVTADADALPYTQEDLSAARDKLHALTAVGPADLPPTDEPRPLTAMLRRKDLLDLFNTDPDLSGFDVDVSEYIRDTGNPGLQVFWRNVTDPNAPEPQATPARDELCPVSVGQASALGKRNAWRWNGLSGHWEPLQTRPRPGMILMLASQGGGYDTELGFSPDSRAPVPAPAAAGASEQDVYDSDWRSRTPLPVALANHLGNAAWAAGELCAALGETDHAEEVVRSARWHDVGKAHPVFDATMHACNDAPAGLLAKSPCRSRHGRRHFRHELASALAWVAENDDTAKPDLGVDLIGYLIAAHHGKVRTSLRAMPDEVPAPGGVRFARGVWQGDRLPALTFDGETFPETELHLALMELGEGEQGRSWSARALSLLDQHGPFRLAWLETLVRIADWRASAAEQEDQDHE